VLISYFLVKAREHLGLKKGDATLAAIIRLLVPIALYLNVV
jgi:hypothetical protein